MNFCIGGFQLLGPNQGRSGTCLLGGGNFRWLAGRPYLGWMRAIGVRAGCREGL